MTFGPTPTIIQTLAANEIPMGEVYTPEDGVNLLQGGPSSTDALNSKKSAPAAMYIGDGKDVTQGASTDANTANSIMGRLTKIRDILLGLIGQQTKANSLSVTIASDENALPVSGAVSVSGTVGVSSLPVLPTGTNAIGTVGVTSLPALPAGTNVIGHVIVDSAGSVAITSLPSLAAGTNVIGHVIVDSASSVAVTSLPSIPAGANAIGSVIANAGTNLNTSALALESGGHLASIDTHIPSNGQKTMAGSLPVTLASDQSNLPLNLAQVLGTAIANTNPVPTQWVAQPGYVALTTPQASTNAGSDTAYTFSSQVNGVVLQNNTAGAINYAFDATASAGSLSLASGQTLIYNKKVTVFHLYTAAAQPVNGTSGSNIVLLGEL